MLNLDDQSIVVVVVVFVANFCLPGNRSGRMELFYWPLNWEAAKQSKKRNRSKLVKSKLWLNNIIVVTPSNTRNNSYNNNNNNNDS